MAQIDKRHFLDILINSFAQFGFKRFIFCLGYLGNIIKRYYKSKKLPIEIIFSKEKVPLDTAGAIKNAEKLIKSNPFLVTNGDTLCRANLREFLNFHLKKSALVSLLLSPAKETKDYATVILGGSQRIVGFNEKSKRRGNFINAGMYFFQREALSLIPANKKFSLEKDLFPSLIDKEFYGYITKDIFIDIGTPERYRKAQKLLSLL